MFIQITGIKVLRGVLRNNELIVRDFNVDLSYLNNDNHGVRAYFGDFDALV
ncbi:hypothetical protein AM101_231 [Acinetobacter phage AM101]|uniref:Uncharacterized protein n=1 Tax=Acinetobacter phage AM101 TaxID=2178927 RepID=A0A4Y1NKA4_9CAUD|nr:hypothetical protein HYP65_gp161 [Acinetobacter phage AM101]AWY10207.1 hypothetical protein AM101_231 [Acinetobacter phage AM101]